MSAEQVGKSRRNLLLVLGVFILPVVLAKLALDQQWFNYGVTNQGELLEQPMKLAELGLAEHNFDKKWLLLINLPANCEQACEQTLLSINNTYIALGKEMPRVTPVALTISSLTEQQLAPINQAKWQFINMPTQARNLLTEPQLMVIDPHGNVVLTHKPPTTAEQFSPFGKAILADMKKLLKYSRIG